MPCALMGGGNHQVLAAKKYAMMAVSTQTTGASNIDSPPLRDPSSLYCIRTWNETSTFDEGRATPVAFFCSGPEIALGRALTGEVCGDGDGDGRVLASGDDSPQAVGSECGGARHPQARQARRVPQQTGEHDHRQRAQCVPVQGLGPAALGEREHSVGQPAEWAGASGEPAEPAEREIRRRARPE